MESVLTKQLLFPLHFRELTFMCLVGPRTSVQHLSWLLLLNSELLSCQSDLEGTVEVISFNPLILQMKKLRPTVRDWLTWSNPSRVRTGTMIPLCLQSLPLCNCSESSNQQTCIRDWLLPLSLQASAHTLLDYQQGCWVGIYHLPKQDGIPKPGGGSIPVRFEFVLTSLLSTISLFERVMKVSSFFFFFFKSKNVILVTFPLVLARLCSNWS